MASNGSSSSHRPPSRSPLQPPAGHLSPPELHHPSSASSASREKKSGKFYDPLTDTTREKPPAETWSKPVSPWSTQPIISSSSPIHSNLVHCPCIMARHLQLASLSLLALCRCDGVERRTFDAACFVKGFPAQALVGVRSPALGSVRNPVVRID